MKRANRIMTVLIFIFLYIPMAVLIVASLFSPVIMKIVNKKAHAIEKQS